MSFEGYHQLICKEGHLGVSDCYDVDPKFWVCHEIVHGHFCGKGAQWWNLVDVTNGSFDEEMGNRIDGYIELSPFIQGDMCCCGSCGHSHRLSPDLYRPPATGGHRTDV